MVTTIQIDELTLQRLKELKEKSNANSYDEIIRRLIEEHEKTPASMFGAHPELKRFTSPDEAMFHEI